MASEASAVEVLAALKGRLGEQGDMHIRVSRHTLDVLEKALGIDWREDQDEHREIDARALEMLIVVAERRSTFAAEQRAAGREEAAKVAEAWCVSRAADGVKDSARSSISIAAAIRALPGAESKGGGNG